MLLCVYAGGYKYIYDVLVNNTQPSTRDTRARLREGRTLHETLILAQTFLLVEHACAKREIIRYVVRPYKTQSD